MELPSEQQMIREIIENNIVNPSSFSHTWGMLSENERKIFYLEHVKKLNSNEILKLLLSKEEWEREEKTMKRVQKIVQKWQRLYKSTTHHLNSN